MPIQRELFPVKNYLSSKELGEVVKKKKARFKEN